MSLDVTGLVAALKEASDDELFAVLDAASEEVKRRNGLLGPSISNVRSNSVEQNVGMVIDAIAAMRQKPGG